MNYRFAETTLDELLQNRRLSRFPRTECFLGYFYCADRTIEQTALLHENLMLQPQRFREIRGTTVKHDTDLLQRHAYEFEGDDLLEPF